MKRLIKKILLLVFLLAAAMAVLNYFGQKAGDIYKDGAALVCETKREMVRSGEAGYQEGKVNVLFLGTSRILAGIIPERFDQLSGGRTYSYNLALPALPIGPAYYILKDYLDRNPPPQYVIMQFYINRCRNCTLFNYYASQGYNGIGELADMMVNLRNKSIFLNAVFPFKMYRFFVIQHLLEALFRPGEIVKLREHNRVILNRMKADRGFYFIEEQAVEGNRLEGEAGGTATREPGTFDPFYDPYTRKFFDLTADRGIKVLLIQPVYRKNQYKQHRELPPHFSILMEHYSHIHMAPRGWKLKMYERRYFGDKTHLNPEGAERYTEEVYTEFQQVFSKDMETWNTETGNGK